MPPKKRAFIGQKSPIARRAKIKRWSETFEQREIRLQKNRINTTVSRNNETPEKREFRLGQNRLKAAATRKRKEIEMAKNMGLSSKWPRYHLNYSKESRDQHVFLHGPQETDTSVWHNSELKINIVSVFSGNEPTLHPSGINASDIYDVSMIKKEVIDPSEQNEELISNHYSEHWNIDPMSVVKTEILDSHEINQTLPPSSVETEDTHVDNAAEKFLKSYYKLFLRPVETKPCFVLLEDICRPENSASTSANFTSLKINKDIPGSSLKPNFPFDEVSKAPFSHIPDTYKKLCTDLVSFRRQKGSGLVKKDIKRRKVFSKGRPPKIKILKDKKKRRGCHKRNVCKLRCSCFNAISIGRQLNDNNVASAHQLCSCVKSDEILCENKEEIFLLNPDFGKIVSGVNQV